MNTKSLQWLSQEEWLNILSTRSDDEWRCGEQSCLLLDLRGVDRVEDIAVPVGLPCPVIGRVDEKTSPGLRQQIDCWVEGDRGLQQLEKNLVRAPIAAGVLVQLSRAIVMLDVPAALDVESMAYATLQSGREYRTWLQGHLAAPKVSRSAPPDTPPVLLQREGDVLTVTLNRPQQHNAVSVAMRDALVEAFSLAKLDTSIHRLALQGNGKCFSIGGDLDEFGEVSDPAVGHWIRGLTLPARALVQANCATTARLHGACIGAGIELPAFAGQVVAARGSFFQLPELSFGLIPGAGGSVSIQKRIGRQRFVWMVLSGCRINVEQALAWGLVDAIGD